jgi:hypothetical protein
MKMQEAVMIHYAMLCTTTCLDLALAAEFLLLLGLDLRVNLRAARGLVPMRARRLEGVRDRLARCLLVLLLLKNFRRLGALTKPAGVPMHGVSSIAEG